MEGHMTMEKPDKTVAEAIKKKLTEKNIIKDTHSSTLANKLSSGNISEQDWKLMAELSIEDDKGERGWQKE